MSSIPTRSSSTRPSRWSRCRSIREDRYGPAHHVIGWEPNYLHDIQHACWVSPVNYTYRPCATYRNDKNRICHRYSTWSIVDDLGHDLLKVCNFVFNIRPVRVVGASFCHSFQTIAYYEESHSLFAVVFLFKKRFGLPWPPPHYDCTPTVSSLILPPPSFVTVYYHRQQYYHRSTCP